MRDCGREEEEGGVRVEGQQLLRVHLKRPDQNYFEH